MKLRLLPTVLQGVRMLPILYGVFGLFEGGAHGLQALRGEFALPILGIAEEAPHGDAEKRPIEEAHLLHPEKPHTPDAPEPNERTRPRLHLVAQQTDKTVNEECRRAGTLFEPLSLALRIFRNHIPSVPERS